jgi:ABC-type multidrug transport system fused ATPase/permease subunit
MAVTSIGRLAAPIIAMAKASTAAAELLATIDAAQPDQSGLKAPEVSAEQDVTFKDVSFVYPSRKDVQVLDKLNLTFETGKVTAIVGPSGSGKSTIVSLLEKWYGLTVEAELPAAMMKVMTHKHQAPPEKEKKKKRKNKAGKSEKDSDSHNSGSTDEVIKVEPPNTVVEGAIFVGKSNLAEIDNKWWRAQIGLVQQEPFLFNDTILQNVAYGLCGTELENLPEEEKQRMVKDACKEAFADEFIEKLPQVCCQQRFVKTLD